MRTLRLGIVLALMALAAACSDDKPTQPVSNPGAAALLVDSANDAMGSAMRKAIDSTLQYGDSSFRPHDLNFTVAHSLYQRAVAADPANLHAHFGVGFTSLLTVLTDPDVSALYERSKRFIDTTLDDYDWQLPALAIPVPGGILGRDVMPTGFPLSPAGVPGILPDLPRLDHSLQAAAVADPQPSDWQSILETKLLPRIKTAQSHLWTVAANRDYVFWVTPEMQGNPGADSVELDMTEVRLALAALYALEAAVDVATARHLDVPAYSRAGLTEAFNVGSSFLTLKSDGVAKMRAAKTALLETLAQADSALEFLRTETDSNQDDDFIPRGSDVVEIRDSVRSAKQYLTQVRTVDITIDYSTLHTQLDVAKFFDNPWNDPKTLMPAYTMTFDVDSSYKSIEETYFSAQAYWDSLYSKFGVTYPNDTLIYPRHLPDAKNDDYYRVLTECQAVWGWTDLYTYYPGATECWYYTSYLQWNYQSAWYDRHHVIVCVEWTANSFAGWNFPDPTFGGLFPGLTNTDLKNFLLPGGEFDWQKKSCESTNL